MSKLLLRWVWGSREELGRQLSGEGRAWERLLGRLKGWKGQNNLTRQFLSSRWHCAGEEARLFRMVSCLFFRRHCRLAISHSNIRHKRMHAEKIGCFLRGVAHPQGLSSLR
jgi:hypothetical protein